MINKGLLNENLLLKKFVIYILFLVAFNQIITLILDMKHDFIKYSDIEKFGVMVKKWVLFCCKNTIFALVKSKRK